MAYKNIEDKRRYNKEWAKNNRDKLRQSLRNWRERNPERSKALHLKSELKNYGITIEIYNSILAKQNFRCVICKANNDNHRLCVDHCHDKGHVRGLLCHKCNRGLGFFRDDPQLLSAAIEYLNSSVTVS